MGLIRKHIEIAKAKSVYNLRNYSSPMIIPVAAGRNIVDYSAFNKTFQISLPTFPADELCPYLQASGASLPVSAHTSSLGLPRAWPPQGSARSSAARRRGPSERPPARYPISSRQSPGRSPGVRSRPGTRSPRKHQ